MDVRSWQPLVEGDIVDIITPSFSVSDDIAQKACAWLTSLKLKPRLNTLAPHPSMTYLAGDDDARFLQLQQALYAKDSKAIWCLRGGFGASRIMLKLGALPVIPQAKLLIGFSDATALHLFFNQFWGWSTLHGPVLSQLAGGKINKASTKALVDIIFGKTSEVLLPKLTPLNDAAKENRTIDALIMGGNMTLLQNSIGTVWQARPWQHILFLEETDERPYRIDRILTHLAQSGMIGSAKALIIGDITDNPKPNEDKDLEAMLTHFAATISIPMLRCKNIGHGKNNMPLPLNTKATLTLGAVPKWICDAGWKR